MRLPKLLLGPRSFHRGIRTHPFLNVSQYFEYARSKQLKTNSTVFNGTSFELASMAQLTASLNGIELHHVGGTNDNGIDLSGKWNVSPNKTNTPVPSSETINDDVVIPILNQQNPELNVLVQCKNYSTKITAKEIRELPGIFHAEFNSINSKNSIMLFCAPNVLTKNGIQQVLSSNIPIGYCQISKMTQVRKGDLYDVGNYKGGELVGFLPNAHLLALLSGTSCIDDVLKIVDRNNAD